MKHHYAPPLSHTTDPQTSYDAADRMVKSGKLQEQEEYVLWQIQKYCQVKKQDTFTAKEVYRWFTFGYYVIQRRLSGLHSKGKIERTGETRNGCKVWRLTK